jgi:penicillin-binding protein 1A
VAGKTGTSEGGRDLWFIGSIPQLTTGVWLGYDNSRETKNTSVVATLAWRDFMAPISKSLPVRQFPPKPQLSGTYKGDAKPAKPEAASQRPVLDRSQAPDAPVLPEAFAPVPEGTPSDGPPSGPGATAAPVVAPTSAAPVPAPAPPPPPVAAPPAP